MVGVAGKKKVRGGKAIISYLGHVLAIVAVPRALAREYPGILGRVQQAADGVDARPEEDVHLHDAERGGDLVLRHLLRSTVDHARTINISKLNIVTRHSRACLSLR